MFGVWQLWTATGLIVFTLTASVMLLNFWKQADVQRRNSITQWHRNLALIGGLLSLLAMSRQTQYRSDCK